MSGKIYITHKWVRTLLMHMKSVLSHNQIIIGSIWVGIYSSASSNAPLADGWHQRDRWPFHPAPLPSFWMSTRRLLLFMGE